MALYSIENISHGTQLGIWKKEETLDLLEAVYILSTYEKKEFAKITNENRKKEWLTTRILLTELLQKRLTILHNKNQKPYLKNHKSNITISHSRHFVTIIVSAKYYPGIDVEHIAERVQKVKHKFLNKNELAWCKNINQITACWSAKESIFKIYEKGLDFHDMEISPFKLDADSGSFKTKVSKKGKEADYLVKYKLVENDVLTYTISKSAIS